jgi:hypothetical protein
MQTFPLFCNQPGLLLANFTITGASVGATQGSAGLDGRGQMLCTIALSGNTYTVDFISAFGDVPYVSVFPLTSDAYADSLVPTKTGFTFNSTTRDANGTPINTANFQVFVFGYNTTSFFS